MLDVERGGHGEAHRVRLQGGDRGEIVGFMGSGRRLRRLAGPALPVVVIVAFIGLCTAGCSYVLFTTHERTAIEQELVVRSIDRAIGSLNTNAITGHRAVFNLYGLTKDVDFAKALLSDHLRARGIQLVEAWESPEVRLDVFASVMGIDQTESLLGIPALQVPVVSVPIPEIALFKWNQNRSHTELRLFAFDQATGRLIEQAPDAEGRAKYDTFKILLIITFSSTDLDERPVPLRP